MGRNCKVCTHENAKEINKALIEGQMTYIELEDRYGISRFSLRRHKQTHLGDVLHEIKRENAAQAVTDFVATMDGYNAIIAKLPKILDNNDPTISQILTAMKDRSNVMGESMGPAEITIKWGMGEDAPSQDHPVGISDDEVTVLEQQAAEVREGRGNGPDTTDSNTENRL